MSGKHDRFGGGCAGFNIGCAAGMAHKFECIFEAASIADDTEIFGKTIYGKRSVVISNEIVLFLHKLGDEMFGDRQSHFFFSFVLSEVNEIIIAFLINIFFAQFQNIGRALAKIIIKLDSKGNVRVSEFYCFVY